MAIYSYRNPKDGSPLLNYQFPVWSGSRAERCFIDPESISALNSLVVGPVEHPDTIIRAESAIRALLFHDAVHLIRPAIKRYYHSDINHDPFVSSWPIGLEPSVAGISNVLDDANYHVELGTIDHVQVFGNEELEQTYVRAARGRGYIEITDTTHEPPKQGRAPADIVAVGVDEEDYYKNTFQKSELLIQNFLAPIPNSGLTAYLTNSTYLDYQARITFQRDDAFFKAIDESWGERKGRIEDFLNVPMEPLIAILLHRAKTREDISAELVNLRQEFADTRRQFWGFVDEAALRTRPPERGWKLLEELQQQAANIIPKGLKSKNDFWPARFMWVGRLAWMIAIEDYAGAARDAVNKVLENMRGPVNYVEMTPKLTEQISKIDWETLVPKHFSEAEIQKLRNYL